MKGGLSHAQHIECNPGDIRLNISIIVQSTLYASNKCIQRKMGNPPSCADQSRVPLEALLTFSGVPAVPQNPIEDQSEVLDPTRGLLLISRTLA